MSNLTGLHNRALRSALSFMVAALMIGSISYLGVHTFKASHAATGASLYVNPDKATVTAGSTLSVSIREDSGADAINSVQASLNYDANKLQYVSLTEGGDFPLLAATSTDTAGVIRVGRGNSDKPLSGDHPVVTITFKVIGSAGPASVGFDKTYSFLVRNSDSQDILQNVGSADYTISATAGATTTLPILYLNPAGGSYSVGSTVAVAVRLNSYTSPVTTVESAIGYPANLLQYVSVSEGGTYTIKQRTNAVNGIVDIIRATAGGSSGVQGDNPVVTINFKVIAAGQAPLTIASASAVYGMYSNGQSILNVASSAGASYSLEAAANATAGTTLTPAGPVTVTSDTPLNKGPSTITSPSQALTIGSSGGSSSVSLTTDASGAVLTQLGGEVSLSPVIDPAIFVKNPNDTVTKVEYYLDGKLLSTQKAAPYSYKFDSKTLRNGSYTMVIKTYFSGGTVDTRADKLLVKNKVTLAYVMRHFLGNILGLVAILAVLAVIMLKLVIPRSHRLQPALVTADHDALYDSNTASSDAGQPVASDPLVVTPNGGVADTSATAVSAAQTTAALPWAAAPTTPAAGTAQPFRPAPRAIVSGPTYRPDVAPPPEASRSTTSSAPTASSPPTTLTPTAVQVDTPTPATAPAATTLPLAQPTLQAAPVAAPAPIATITSTPVAVAPTIQPIPLAASAPQPASNPPQAMPPVASEQSAAAYQPIATYQPNRQAPLPPPTNRFQI